MDSNDSDVGSLCGSELPSNVYISFWVPVFDEDDVDAFTSDVLCETEDEALRINEDVFASMLYWIRDDTALSPMQKVMKWVHEDGHATFKDATGAIMSPNAVCDIFQKFANNFKFVDSFEFI